MSAWSIHWLTVTPRRRLSNRNNLSIISTRLRRASVSHRREVTISAVSCDTWQHPVSPVTSDTLQCPLCQKQIDVSLIKQVIIHFWRFQNGSICHQRIRQAINFVVLISWKLIWSGLLPFKLLLKEMCMSLCRYVGRWVGRNIYLSIHLCACVGVGVGVYLSVSFSLSLSLYIYMCVCVCVCLCVCVHTHAHTHIHTYIRTCIHTYICRIMASVSLQLFP